MPADEKSEPTDATRSSTADNDVHKGAIEDDRRDPGRSGAPGLDENGLPNDATAIAQDAVGAREDKSQG
jgi:hypothetical protein